MSRKANCWDNAPMESFFGTLKTALVQPPIPRSRYRAARPVRIYRRLLQSCADPLRHRLHHPTAGRGESRITSCPLFRGKVSFLYPRARGRRNFLARRCAPTVSGAGPRSDHRINCRRCEQCFAHCFGEGPAARRSPQIGIGLATRFAVSRRLLSLNYLRVVAFAAKLKTTLVTLTARAECGRSTVIRGRQNVNFERSN